MQAARCRSTSCEPGSARRPPDETVEQALLRGIVAGGVLGMPLHCEQECVVDLQRLDDPVLGAADDAQTVAEVGDRLMVMTRRGDGGRVHDIREERTRFE